MTTHKDTVRAILLQHSGVAHVSALTEMPGNPDSSCIVVFADGARIRLDMTDLDSVGGEEMNQPGVCQYNSRHQMNGVPATTFIDGPGEGRIPACDACFWFHDRMNRESTR
jgi:hypothetical protein